MSYVSSENGAVARRRSQSKISSEKKSLFLCIKVAFSLAVMLVSELFAGIAVVYVSVHL